MNHAANNASRCTGPNVNDSRIFPERCNAPAVWVCPSGPRCDECAQREMKAIRDGACLLAILADDKGIPRQTIIDKYKRI